MTESPKPPETSAFPADILPQSSLGQSAVKGVFWVGGGRAIKQFVAIGTSIALARLLAPNDFGVFAMIFFAMELAQVFTDFGFGTAIVQRRVTDPVVLSTSFWLNMGIALLVGAIMIAAGPLLAKFFEQPIVASLAIAGALNVVIACAMVVPQALLTQRFAFRAQTQAQLIGSVVGGGAALMAAFAGAGVWSLVVQPIAGTLVTLVITFRAARWLPSWGFSYASVREMMGFGANLLGSNVIDTLGRSMHNIILGKWLGAAPLGIYNMAHGVTYFPIYQVSAVVVKVLFPTLVSLNDEPDRFRAAYLRIVGAIALVTFPTMTGLFAVADDFVAVVFGSQWLGMIPVLKVICWVVMCQSVATTSSTVLLSKGDSRILFRLSVISTIIMGVALLIGSQWGLLGTAYGYAIATMLSFAMLIHFSLKKIGLALSVFLLSMRGSLGASLAMTLVVMASVAQMPTFHPALRLGLGIVIGAAAYTAFTWLLNRKEAMGIIKLVVATLGKRRAAAPASE